MNYEERKMKKNSMYGFCLNEQNHTSANTSINKTRIPTAFTKVKPYGHVCDYGCGKYTDHIKKWCQSEGCLSYNPYDKYNQDENTNERTMYVGQKHGYDTIYCCNVLNVIDSDNEIWKILHDMYNMLLNHSKLIIQIYEGNKTGNGCESKFDCYQRNEKVHGYTRFFGAFQGRPFKYEIKGNIIIVTKL